MGWIEGLNDAMDYIEANLEGDLDLAHAARLAACTEGQFRRMFSYIAGIGLGEYVRRRRISRAALDLSRGERVVDVAVRYGYCSPTAFNRAFRDALGISPSEAKRPGAPLSVFPRLSLDPLVGAATSRLFRNRDGDARDGPLPGAGAGSLGCRGRPGIAAGPSPS